MVFCLKKPRKITSLFADYSLIIGTALRRFGRDTTKYIPPLPKRVVAETVPIGYSIGEPQKNDPSDTGSWLFSFKGDM
jgi:hypothetical protein